LDSTAGPTSKAGLSTPSMVKSGSPSMATRLRKARSPRAPNSAASFAQKTSRPSTRPDNARARATEVFALPERRLGTGPQILTATGRASVPGPGHSKEDRRLGMQQRKSGVSDSADKLPLANPRHRWLGRRGSNLRHISSIRRLAPPKHSEPTSCRQHRRRCFRLPNIAPTAIARGEECCWRTAKMLFARSQSAVKPRAQRARRELSYSR